MKDESMVHSYEVGKDPYKPDETRGKWSSIWDFYLVCVGHAFGTQNFCIIAAVGLMDSGLLVMIPLILTTLLVSVPLYFIQSTLGQFSSSGFISVFRVSPIFKGIGYVTLALNITAMTYLSSFVGLLLFSWFNSYRSDLPWQGCNHQWNSPNCTENITSYRGYTYQSFEGKKLAAAEYIQDLLHGDFAWGVCGCTLLVWIGLTVFALAGVQKMGQIMRLTTSIALVILFVLIIRSLFLPGAAAAIGDALKPRFRMLISPIPWILAPFLNTLIFGSGWSSVLTLSSFNDCRTENQKYSLILPFVILGLSFCAGILTTSVIGHLEHAHDTYVYVWEEGIDFPFVLFPAYALKLGATHLWLLMFYTMLLCLEVNTMGVLYFTTLTSIFDEYVAARPFKKPIIMGLSFVLFLFSIMYSQADGFHILKSLGGFAIFSHLCLNFVQLLVYVWAYGRERFLRDIQFILGNPLGQWKFYILRFVTPAILVFCMFLLCLFSVYTHEGGVLGVLLTIIMKILPWIAIPGYAIYKMVSMTGTILQRFRRGVTPTDWYPIDPTYRREYEIQQGSTDTTHLVGMDELCEEEAEA